MTPEEAYEWLAPKLSSDERSAFDVVMNALRAMRQSATVLDVRALASAAALPGEEYHADLAWLQRVAAIVATSEREACAQLLEVSNAALKLMAGEMTAQELRTTQAVLKGKAAAIRGRERLALVRTRPPGGGNG
ncbi:hypothetical protein [Ottowia sp.]|uniref:hypothetical protein n=1 Tax=Ottowia sp. TaxID=1898956 RepID=UPI0025DC70D9|nr:hypothetical protein [Ottowia sp.]MBK6616391.1 hypothetical protein [Ottowia sp.]